MKRAWMVAMLAALMSSPGLAEEGEGFAVLEHAVYRAATGKAKVSAAQAVEAAGRDGGGRPVEFEMDMQADLPVFELECAAGSGAKHVTVDAITGKVLVAEDERLEADAAGEFAATSKALAESKFTLSQAIEAAASHVKGGTVVAAGAEATEGNLKFKILLLDGATFRSVELGADGKLQRVEEEKASGQVWVFDEEPAGKSPGGWRLGYTNAAEGKGTWLVTRDAKAVTGPNVLTLDAASGSGTFNLAIAEGASYKDVDVRTRLRPNSGKEDQGGGVIWRCKDENNYYICRVNPLEANFRVYKVVDGKRQQLQGVEAHADAGTWHVVRAKMVGNRIICYLDGKKLLDTTDEEFKDGGMVGLWTKADASSSFDNVAVRPGKLSRRDQAAIKPSETATKDADDDDDDDDDKPEAGKAKP